MKISKEQLNEYIKLYLNDVEDYGEDDELIIAETTLSKLQNNLITESEFDLQSVITEAINKSQSKSKLVLNDFFMYVENI
jgi:L-lactate utilization protein LutC